MEGSPRFHPADVAGLALPAQGGPGKIVLACGGTFLELEALGNLHTQVPLCTAYFAV